MGRRSAVAQVGERNLAPPDVSRMGITPEARHDAMMWRLVLGHTRFWLNDTPAGDDETCSSLGSADHRRRTVGAVVRRRP
jgi:hypothetical protein